MSAWRKTKPKVEGIYEVYDPELGTDGIYVAVARKDNKLRIYWPPAVRCWMSEWLGKSKWRFHRELDENEKQRIIESME